MGPDADKQKKSLQQCYKNKYDTKASNVPQSLLAAQFVGIHRPPITISATEWLETIPFNKMKRPT